MKVALSWLKELVDIDITPKQLEEKLFSCGFEVEELIDLSAEINRVVAGRITEIQKQEGTDKLQLCKIDCGEHGSAVEITTGAQNVFEGATVPVALDGSTLPGGITIKSRKMQGVMSHGMLCSGTELGINDDWYESADVNGVIILGEDVKPGTDICEIVGLNDYIFDISVTANRPDCQSVLGIAREVAAVLNKKLKMPEMDFTATAKGDESIGVCVQAPDLCPRYMAHYVKNIRPSKSPSWLRRHLALSGLRSINNIVDITNHTLLEIGQPMHAFDLDKISGRKITVRRAAEGEKIITLDEKEFTLNANHLAICDESGPVALAGVMGGLDSGIQDSSKELLFECATFARDSVRKTSRALGQSSDSSLRYEKGVDEHTTQLGLARALHLIQKLDCGDITDTSFDCRANSDKKDRVISVLPKQIYGVLGIEVPLNEMIAILERLEFEVKQDGDTLNVTVPPYREDVHDYPDLAEEIIREYGYEHIKPTFLKCAAVTKGGLNETQKLQLKLKRMLCGQGFYEMSSLAFYSAAHLDLIRLAKDDKRRSAVRLLNPITENLSIMRTVLAPSTLGVIVDNIKKGNLEGRLFELGNVYIPNAVPVTERPSENLTLSIGVFGKDEDFYTLKGVLQQLALSFGTEFTYKRGSDSYLHPGITAEIYCAEKYIGVFGKLANEVTQELDVAKDQKQHCNIYMAELDYTAFEQCVPEAKKYVPISAYDDIKRDLALVCDESVTCGEITDVIFAAGKLVKDVQLFDVYRGANLGEGKKSMAFSVVLRDLEEIEKDTAERLFKKVLADLQYKLGVQIR